MSCQGERNGKLEIGGSPYTGRMSPPLKERRGKSEHSGNTHAQSEVGQAPASKLACKAPSLQTEVPPDATAFKLCAKDSVAASPTSCRADLLDGGFPSILGCGGSSVAGVRI